MCVVRVEKLVGADVRKRRVVRAEGARDDPGRERVQELAQDDAVPQARAETLSGRGVGWVRGPGRCAPSVWSGGTAAAARDADQGGTS